MATKVAKDTSLEDRLHPADVIRRQLIGLVKLDLAVVNDVVLGIVAYL